MKKIVLVVTCLLCTTFLSACGGNDDGKTTESTGPVYVDQEFLDSLGKGLEERWSYAEDIDDDGEKEGLQKATNHELTILDRYTSGQFKDTKLQEKAIAYINELKNGLEVLDTYGSDSFYQKWDKHYATRTKMLVDLSENYTIPISEKYQATLKELTAHGTEVAQKEKVEEEIQALLQNASFTDEGSDDGITYRTYTATIENTTGLSINNLMATVNLLDGEGVVVDTSYLNANNWRAGQKYKFEFMTDKEFQNMDVDVSHYQTED
ncbi:FxLYD domain-containing protein [Enterococcus pallens]|uniref:DUF5105 domain-containing protein n=1 Tax=Enterococcus pallens ATCC BAA-351 TaxID=1158607 RepID=R2QBG5_9ENTE|nr:FxLYD domain-containing protein [Enterococcus pallens]EOH93772.1 hypothetical protein UAU_02468 [Enterococcus pallens ATCC BAA-351]EOU24612.1 hypothetical protein I588_00599 [Enterococcus pallens ATCC BAA-351]OJG79566.1 hypothetical protein RV10_GL000693 [Enterococcus pallens]